MMKKFMMVMALAMTALMVVPPDIADARGRGGGGFRAGGGVAFRAGPAFRGGSFRAFRGPSVRYRPVYRTRIIRRGYYGYGPVFIAGRRCGWLRQRALITGSPYWWRRYRICRGY